MITPRQAAIGADLFTGFVVASVAVALAGLTWRLAGDAERDAAPIVAAEAAPPPAADLGPVTSFAPFGRAAPTVAGPSSSGLQLRGILLAVPRAASTVLIAASGGQPQPFAIGQDVGGGAIVDSVEADRVLLRVGGRLEELSFAKRGANGASSSSPGSASPSMAPPPVSIAPPQASVVPQRFMPAPDSSSRIGANPQSFLDSIGATATTGGYRIGASPPASVRQAGLMPGDVIEKVNGTVVGDVERDRQLFGAAALGGPMRLDVMRDGRRVTLSVSGR